MSGAEVAGAVAPTTPPVLTAEAAYLLRFAEEAYAALATCEPDPVEAEERAAADSDENAAECAGG